MTDRLTGEQIANVKTRAEAGYVIGGVHKSITNVNDVFNLLAHIASQDAEIERLKAAYHDIGNTVLNLSEEFQDEGDRVYLGSTNDAEIFRQLGAKYWEWRLEQETPTPQPRLQLQRTVEVLRKEAKK